MEGFTEGVVVGKKVSVGLSDGALNDGLREGMLDVGLREGAVSVGLFVGLVDGAVDGMFVVGASVPMRIPSV